MLLYVKVPQKIYKLNLVERDHMVHYENYITTFTKTAVAKLGWNTYTNKMIPFLYVTSFIITRFLYFYM